MPSPPSRVIVLLVLCSLFCNFKGYADATHYAEGESDLKFEVTNDTLRNPKLQKFETKYDALITRAYFKIIVEAERADIELSKEFKEKFLAYQNSISTAALTEDLEQELDKVYVKFSAHRKMLKGLKSWRIFSDYRTGDLAYFKTENYNQIYAMYKRGSNDFTMVKVLMYKLADLYHFGE